MRKAIAIDFDGCLCSDNYPSVGDPNWEVIEAAKKEKENGAGLILWTCREGSLLDDAIKACAVWGLEFDAVNESLPDWIESFATRPRKVGASEYWDDKSVTMPKMKEIPLEEAKRLKIGTPVWLKYECITGFYALVNIYRENGIRFIDCYGKSWFSTWKLYGRDWKLYKYNENHE